MIDFSIILNPKYKNIFDKFVEIQNNLSEWDLLNNLIYLNCLKDDWETVISNIVRDKYSVEFYLENIEEVKSTPMSDEYIIYDENNSPKLILPLGAHSTDEIYMKKFSEEGKIAVTPLCYRSDFKPSIRLLTDVILTDAYELRCTDVHFKNESNIDGSFRYVVKFRRGLYTYEQSQYTMSKDLIEDIINDLLENRSSVKNKLAELYTTSAIRFRLLDSDFHTRCQIARSIGGLTLVIRLLYFGDAPSIEKLGFNKHTNDMLESVSRKMNGLTLVSGVFGSGKGTTLNAVGMHMEEEGKFSMASLDDPIEYRRRYPQFEYSNEYEMLEFVEGFKKMDLNVVFLNEIINSTGSQAVYNLVTSGVHVLTTVHTSRLYRIMYKLHELLGANYLSLIPFLNVVSYQDKFSICCETCSTGSFIDHYEENSDEYKLLSYLGLEAVRQPVGCSECYNGVLISGIKVVSEHLVITEVLKSQLLKLDLNEQFDLLKNLTEQGNSLEKEIACGLSSGSILISEALVKLDSWR